MLYKKPVKVRNLILANRIVRPPMATRGTKDGIVQPEQVEYYRKTAGYTGLVILEHCYVNIEGKASEGMISIADDSTIPELRKITDAVHGEGVTKIFVQINHAGSAAFPEVTGLPLVGPSAVRHPRAKTEELPHALTEDEIIEREEWFVRAALRAKEAGFDGVEVHSAHGYFLNEFFSPVTNHRTDRYGCGTMEDRTRIHCEVLQKIRKAVGEDYPIAIRLGCLDSDEHGTTPADAAEAAPWLAAAGADLIDVTGGVWGYIREGHTEPGYYSAASMAVKEALERAGYGMQAAAGHPGTEGQEAGRQIPVILTGGVKTPAEAEKLLQENAADLIGVGRAMLADEEWTKKAMTQKREM